MPRSKEAAMRRKKKGKFTKKECPFPIPMPSSAGESVGSWFYYTGFIEGSTVVVRQTGDMDFLYRMGFFGKGTLSRSQPNFSERKQRVNIELPQRNGNYKVAQTVVVNKRSYLAHKRFKALADGRMKEYNDIVYQEEQQQGFVDSSDEEEEKMGEDSSDEVDEDDEEEEEEDDDDDDDDDSVSSAEVDSGKLTAFKLLNQENSSTDAGQKHASTSTAESGDSVGVADISAEVRSHIVSMLAKISLLSSEQITTFLQVPEDVKQLADRYKKMRKAEVNMLQQAFAAKFPGRNFKKGEVITLDEDDCAPDEGGHSGNESDNAVVISDSDDGDGEVKSGNDVSRMNKSGFEYDGSSVGETDDKSLNKSKELSKKAVSSKRDLADWSSDDSNFWSEEPQVPIKNISDKLQTTTGEEMIVQDRASNSVGLCHDEEKKKSVDANNDGETAVSTNSDEGMTEPESVANKLKKEDGKDADMQQTVASTNIANKLKKEVGNDADTQQTAASTNSDQGMTEPESVANKLKKEDGNDADPQQTDAKNMAACNIGENKSPAKKTHQGANGGEPGDVPESKDTQPNAASSPFIEDNAVNIPQATNSSNDAVRNTESLRDISTDDKLVVKGDDKMNDNTNDSINILSKDEEKSAVNSLPSINGNTCVSYLKNSLDINQENSLNSSDFSMETDVSKADEASQKSEDIYETKASVSEGVEMLDQSLGTGVGKALGAIEAEGGTASPSVLETIRLGKENQLEVLDSVLRISSSQDLAKDIQEANSSHTESRKQSEEIGFPDTESYKQSKEENLLHTESRKQSEKIGVPGTESHKQSKEENLLGTESHKQSEEDNLLDTESHKQSEEDNLLDTESHKQSENSRPHTESHKQSEENSHLDKESHKQSKENSLSDTESHKQSADTSKATNVLVGLQIETSVTNSESSVRDKSIIVSNSVESVTHIDSDNSNDSDDVICIESKSAEPKKLHNFLSQPVKKISVPVVTKSVTFMSAITHEPTFVSASVGFQSWGPLLHFNFTGDPSHLPTVMAVSSSPPPAADQRAPPNGQSQKPDIVYERIYPPIKSLVPNGNSTGAVIKQRLKGLPILNTAYSQLLQAQDVGTAAGGLPRMNHLKEPTASKPSERRFQPYPRMLVDQQLPALATQKIARSHSPDSHQSARRASSDAPRINFSLVLSYIDAYQSVSPPPSEKMEMSDGTENASDISSRLVSLSSIIVKISKLYNAVLSKEPPDITTEDQAKHRTETENVLAEFHLALSHYLSRVEISSTLETHLLALLLSEKENNSENISEKNMVEAKSRLSTFQQWLLKKRLEYLKKDQQVDNRHASQKVVVVDLTNNSDDKVHILHPQSGLAGNMVVDLTEKSDKLNDPLNDSKLEQIIDDDLIVEQVKDRNKFVKKSNIENDSLLDSNDSFRDSDGSRQQNQVTSEAGSLQTTNSGSKSESLSEEHVTGEMSEGQIYISSTEESKKETLSQENVGTSLHDDNTDSVDDGIVCDSLPEANISQKLNAEHVSDDMPEGNVIENVSEGIVCKSLVEESISKSEDTRQNNEVVFEETLKHSRKTLETENRKRKYERSHDGASEVNGKKLKSGEDRLLELDEVDEKAGTSSRSQDHTKETGDTSVIGSNGCSEVGSNSLMEALETADSLSKAETSLEVLGQVSCLADKLDVKVRASQELGSSGQLSLDSGDLLCKSTDQETIDNDAVQLVVKEGIGCVKDAVDNSRVSNMELMTPTEIEDGKMDSSKSSDADTPCQQHPSGETKKEDQLLKPAQSSLANAGDSSTVTLEDENTEEKMDITTTGEVKQDTSREAAESMSSNSSSVTGVKTEKLTKNGEGLLQQGTAEQSTDGVNCLVSSESDSEDVSCISAIEKPRSPGANKEVNSLLKKVQDKKKAPEASGKGSLQKPGTSQDIHIFIGSSSDEAEEPPAKRHTARHSSTHGTHPYSARDDPDGNLFVVANTSDEDYEDCSDEDSGEEGRATKRRQLWWRSCVKKDPYPTEEKLQLMLEEAFFLSFGLGCLRILDPEMKLLDLSQMWQQFQVLKEHFIPHYAAYHYFRSKGWVPKSGLKFGCDLILYREGPPFYHGSYSVVVIAVKDATLLPVNTHGGIHLNNRKLNWVSLAGLNRITEHVAKELMLCYVIWPANMTYEESLSPDCISRFKVKEQVVSRWVSSQERESKFGEEEMP